MSFAPIDIVFNLAVLLFWFRIWNPDEREMLHNSSLSGLAALTQPVLDLFRGLFRIASPSFAAAAAWFLLILLRGLALPALNPESARQAWILRFGFAAASPALRPGAGHLFYVMFSLLSFALVLFQVWGLAMLFTTGRANAQADSRPAGVLRAVARPFSDIAPKIRPWVLLIYGILLAIAVNLAAGGWLALQTGSVAGLLMRYAIMAASGVADLLVTLRFLLIVLIIGSWVVIFSNNEALMITSREWLDFLLGPFRRYPVHIGPLDITPIIAFLALDIMHWLLNGFILRFLYIVASGAGGGG